MDLVFRIDPGPGNYSIRGDRTSPLVEKDPAHPFWAAYQANSGVFGTGGTGPSASGGNGGVPQGSIDNGTHPAGSRWNKDWWNSCRMDSAEMNLYPVVSRGLGNPVEPGWMGTIHELDPKFAILGIDHLKCFLSNPAGSVDMANIDCGTPGAVPPSSGYSATTVANWGAALIDAHALQPEGTKILPDGYFTPGTHIEYFVRSSYVQDPGAYTLFYDTLEVYPHGMGAYEDRDAERFAHVDVLPDGWKDTRFNGPGLACLLLVDASDRIAACSILLAGA
jgi:hypothetical protein